MQYFFLLFSETADQSVSPVYAWYALTFGWFKLVCHIAISPVCLFSLCFLSVYLFFRLSVSLFLLADCLFVRLPVCLFVCLSVYPYFHLWLNRLLSHSCSCPWVVCQSPDYKEPATRICCFVTQVEPITNIAPTLFQNHTLGQMMFDASYLFRFPN